MIKQEKAISFNSFFIIEFMDRVLQKARSRFTPHITEIIENLADGLKSADDPVLVLEKLARYQETNDMSIFLFDMLSRVEKIAPEQAMQSLDGLSDDFINLYALMTEDSEVLTTLEVLTNELKKKIEKVPEEKKKPLKEATVLSKEKAVPFATFYRDEAKMQLLAALPEEDRADFTSFLKIALQDDVPVDELNESLSDVLAALRSVFPKDIQAHSARDLMARLPQKTAEAAQHFRTFKKENEQMLREIIESETLPRKAQPEEKGEMTIDALLKEYFRSEVEDYIQLIEQVFNEPFSQKALPKIIKYFKSLKEVSMIHGYTGVEYLCERLMETLRAHEKEVQTFGKSFVQAMKHILAQLRSLRVLDYDSGGQELKDEVDRLSTLLEDALKTPAPEEIPATEPTTEPESIPEKEEMQQKGEEAVQETAPETKEETAEKESEAETKDQAQWISVDDRPQMVALFRELLEKLTSDLRPFDPDGKPEKFMNALQAVTKSAVWLQENINDLFFDPFLTVYENIFRTDALKKEEALHKLSEGWGLFLQELLPELRFEKTKKFWQSFNFEEFVNKKQQTALAWDDDQTVRALSEAMQALWRKKVADQISAALTEGREEALHSVAQFTDLLLKNLQQLQLTDYEALPAFFADQFIKQKKHIGNSVLLDEITQAFDLFFERLAEKGRQGASRDLADVLSEVLAEEAVLNAPAQAEISEDEQEFAADSRNHLQKAAELIEKLKENPQNRDLFKTIAGEVHAVYSAAQFMNREPIADAAIVVEESAEMFAAPDVALPEDLLDRMLEAVHALQEMVEQPELEKTEPFAALQAVLDQLVLEEPREGESKGKATGEKLPEEVQEKPLFSTKITDENELREIFKEDARNLLNTLLKANQALLRNPVDEEAIREFDQAVHSLKNAAKMTGLDDLALLFGRFEEVSEQLKEHSSVSTKKLQEEIAVILQELEPLIFKGELSTADLDIVLARMDELASSVISAQKGEEERNKRLRSLFVEEAKELIDKINHDLIELEKVPESGTILAELMRHLHTLKGGAMMANYNKIGELTHKLEDYFQLYREQNAETKLELLPTAFTIIDLISEMVRSVEQGKPELVSEFTARLADIDNKLFYLKDFEMPHDRQPIEGDATTKQPLAVQEADNTIKIKASFVDHLVNLATELVVNRTELTSYFETLKKLAADLDRRKKDIRHFTHQFEDFLEESSFADLKNLPPSVEQDYEMLTKFAENLKNFSGDYSEIATSIGKLMRSLEKNVSQLSVLSKSLHGDLLKARMLPIRLLFERFERPVRDLARKQRKQVELIVEDNGAELDRAMVEALYEPLLHIIRNAVDHGIEKPAQRKKAGKEPKGKIILRARQEKGQVVIDIIDDGQGIDPEKIRQKIIDLKLMKKKEAQELSESRLLEFIFAPDFSTSDKTTDVSGRGIGLDVVVSEIQKLKGIVRVKTNINQGTVFSIRVPLTLIVSQAMLIKFHDQTLAVPLIAVMESLEIGEGDILLDDQRSYVQVRGKLLPYVDIDSVLRLPDAAQTESQPKTTAVILHDSGVSIALGIEEIIGRQDIVIKNLGSLLQNVELISGGTILASGEVALILDYASLIHKVETEFFAASREKQLVRKIISSQKRTKVNESEGFIDQGQIFSKTITGRKPVVMVVDDAMSVREFISTFLERNGFDTLKAEDGKKALQMLKKKPVDLLITDLEMPVMHGFDLIKKVRDMAAYKDLPIIILTAQAGKNFQAKGAEIGANAFISKPFKEGDLLRMINAFIQVDSEK